MKTKGSLITTYIIDSFKLFSAPSPPKIRRLFKTRMTTSISSEAHIDYKHQKKTPIDLWENFSTIPQLKAEKVNYPLIIMYGRTDGQRELWRRFATKKIREKKRLFHLRKRKNHLIFVFQKFT